MSPPIDSTKVPSFVVPSDLLSSFQFERLLSSGKLIFILYATFDFQFVYSIIACLDPVLQSFNILGTAIPSNSSNRVSAILRLARKQTLLNEADLAALSELKAWERLEMVSKACPLTILCFY